MRHQLVLLVLATAIVCFLAPLAVAADKPDPTGTWKWTYETPNGQSIDQSVQLKLEEDKLSGVYIGRGGQEVEIQDATLEEDQVAFTVVRERGGQEIILSFSGKLEGDEITGSVEIDFGGQGFEGEWLAMRAVELAGTWNLSMTTPDGRTFDNVLELQQQDGTLGGTITGRRGESELQDVKVDGAKLTFNVVRERDGQEFVMKYSGELKGDKLTGNMEIDFGGQAFEIEFEGTRGAA